MPELKNTFSWSSSRASVFKECRRKYFFQYYGSWGGWVDTCDARTRQIYLLKQLKTRALWSGSVVHDHIQKTIERIQSASVRGEKLTDTKIGSEEEIEGVLETMRKDFRASREARYINSPKTLRLFEHEYEMEVPPERWKENAEHVKNCLRTFFSSDVFEIIKGLQAASWLEVEKLSHFMLQDLKVWAVLDFSYTDGEKIIIYDWKTGKKAAKTKTGDHSAQLACYTMYASSRWGVEPSAVSTTEFNLALNESKSYSAENLDIEGTCADIVQSATEMMELLDEVKTNSASEDKFPLTEDENTCRYCNFKKVCEKWA